jgi:fucose permease
VDVVGTSDAVGSIAVGVWTGAFLVGSALAIPFLRRFDGLRYLRASAIVSGVLFVTFLAVPSAAAKLVLVAGIGVVNAGWYPVLKARLYDALHGVSGLVLAVGALFPLNAVLPLGIAGLAEHFGLGTALLPLLAAPIALLLLVPQR